MRRRFQFSLKTMIWLMLCVACFFGGMAANQRLAETKQAAKSRQAKLQSQRLYVSIGARMRESSRRNAELLELQGGPKRPR
jgi:hypothetical protein